MKRRFEMWSNDESGYRANEPTAASDLRNEQAKLYELQQRLDTMERQLEKTLFDACFEVEHRRQAINAIEPGR